jgi:hypothetical protein
MHWFCFGTGMCLRAGGACKPNQRASAAAGAPRAPQNAEVRARLARLLARRAHLPAPALTCDQILERALHLSYVVVRLSIRRRGNRRSQRWQHRMPAHRSPSPHPFSRCGCPCSSAHMCLLRSGCGRQVARAQRCRARLPPPPRPRRQGYRSFHDPGMCMPPAGVPAAEASGPEEGGRRGQRAA